MPARSYKDAITALNSLQSNAAVLADIRTNWKTNVHKVIPETLEYLKRAGYRPDELNALNVLHITGTKGKGSTSAFCSSILCHLYPERKIGLYTSPHLVAVRERIRINGRPLAEDTFARYFFEIWDRFGEAATVKSELPPRPAYARFLTILAFHVFAREQVHATVLEVGIGGTHDATNVVPRPIAAGVTALGLDHVAILGNTLAEIAHHKGGIFKPDVPALSVEQPADGLEVLGARAEELKAKPIKVVPSLPSSAQPDLGLAGSHQLSNAAMAIALVREYMAATSSTKERSKEEVEATILHGLRETRWPGRCQTLIDQQRPGLTWYLDGAHTIESLDACAAWFADVSSLSSPAKRRKRGLIFNITSDRTGSALLSSFLEALAKHSGRSSFADLFGVAVFCTNTAYKDGGGNSDLSNVAAKTAALPPLTGQKELAKTWQTIVPGNVPAHVCATIEEAIETIEASRSPDQEVEVLVTGSLHLIGGLMDVAKLPVE